MHPSGRTAGVDEGPPRPLRIDVRVIPAEVGSLLRQGDQVGDGVALAVIDAPHLFLPGVGDLFEGLRDLYLGVAGLALVHGHQLIDRPKDGIAPRRNQPLPDAEGVDAALLLQYGTDRELVQAVGDDDLAMIRDRR